MATVTSGHLPAFRELLHALGLGFVPVSHLVIDIPVDGIVRCYAVAFPPPESVPAMVRFVQAVSVSEKGEITTSPLPFTQNAVMLAHAVLAGEIDAARGLADEIIGECGGK